MARYYYASRREVAAGTFAVALAAEAFAPMAADLAVACLGSGWMDPEGHAALHRASYPPE